MAVRWDPSHVDARMFLGELLWLTADVDAVGLGEAIDTVRLRRAQRQFLCASDLARAGGDHRTARRGETLARDVAQIIVER